MPLTRSDIRQAVIQNTQRPDKASTINLAINLCVAEISQRHRFACKRVEETITVQQDDLSFPLPDSIENLYDIRVVDSIGTLVHMIRIRTKVEIERQFPALGNYPVSGTPAFGYIENRVFHFMPKASRAFDMFVTGYSAGTELDNDSDRVFPGIDLAVIAYATSYVFMSIQQFGDAQVWDAQYGKALLLAKRNDKYQPAQRRVMEPFPPHRPRYIVDPTKDPWAGRQSS